MEPTDRSAPQAAHAVPSEAAGPAFLNAMSVLDRLGLAALVQDAEGRILFANAPALKLFGLDSRTLCACHVRDLLVEAPPPPRSGPVTLTLKSGEAQRRVVLAAFDLAPERVLLLFYCQPPPLRPAPGEAEAAALRGRLERLIGGQEFIAACCVCGKVRLADGAWIPPSDAGGLHAEETLSHGYCPACARDIMQEYAAQREAFLRSGGGASPAPAPRRRPPS
jgi:hypothetical protein